MRRDAEAGAETQIQAQKRSVRRRVAEPGAVAQAHAGAEVKRQAQKRRGMRRGAEEGAVAQGHAQRAV